MSVLIWGSALSTPELRHEVPAPIYDPLLYLEHGDQRVVIVSPLDASRLQASGGLEVLTFEDFGFEKLMSEGRPRNQALAAVMVAACARYRVTAVKVPERFPLWTARALEMAQISVMVDRELFDMRRRRKSALELEGIRRASTAADAALAAISERLARADTAGTTLTVEGVAVTCEGLKRLADDVLRDHGCAFDQGIIAHGDQGARGHDMGSGPIAAGETVIVDLWPRDVATGTYTDVTRTFVVGEIPEEIASWHRLCLDALNETLASVRPGASTRDLHHAVSDLFARNGFETATARRTDGPQVDGFFHNLGHGVGLEVHESPLLDRWSDEVLVEGDVVAVEPGLYRSAYGGCRLEDTVLVTSDGSEALTVFPYDLTPRSTTSG